MTERRRPTRVAKRGRHRFVHDAQAVACGDGHAMLEADFVGTHIGEFEGIPATSRHVRVPYAVAYDIAGNQITALRLYFPLDALLRQIGAGVRDEASAAV